MGRLRFDLPAVELDDNLAIAVVIDFFELADIACDVRSVCCRRLNDALHRRIRERVRSLHVDIVDLPGT